MPEKEIDLTLANIASENHELYKRNQKAKAYLEMPKIRIVMGEEWFIPCLVITVASLLIAMM